MSWTRLARMGWDAGPRHRGVSRAFCCGKGTGFLHCIGFLAHDLFSVVRAFGCVGGVFFGFLGLFTVCVYNTLKKYVVHDVVHMSFMSLSTA
jgi:hypothetical protein